MKTIKLLICLLFGCNPVFAMIPSNAEEAINMANKEALEQKPSLYNEIYQAYAKSARSTKAAIEYLDAQISKQQNVFNQYDGLLKEKPHNIRFVYEFNRAKADLLNAQALKASLEKDPSQMLTDIQNTLGSRANEIEEEQCPAAAVERINAPQEVGYLVPLWNVYLFNGAEALPIDAMQQILKENIDEQIKQYNDFLHLSLVDDERGNPLSDFTRKARTEAHEEARQRLPYFKALQTTMHNNPRLAIDNIHDALGSVAQKMRDVNNREMFKAQRAVALTVKNYLNANTISELRATLKNTSDAYNKGYMGIYGSKTIDVQRMKRQGVAARVYSHQLETNPQKTIAELKQLTLYKKQSGC
jgi:hypothetical protein